MVNNTYHPRGSLVHGFKVRKHPLYHVWASMKSRCDDPKSSAFRYYGGRGIGYCKRWVHFKNFAEDMWPRPEGKTLERKNNNKDYSPTNCIWADRFQQARNRRIFENSQSRKTGVVPTRRGFNARYDYEKVRYDLGNFDTIKEAVSVRRKFIRLLKAGDPIFKTMLSGGHPSQRLRRNSSTKIKGITKHVQGFVVRKTVGGERIYLGFAKTLDAAKELIRG